MLGDYMYQERREEDSADPTIQRLKYYTEKHDRGLIKTTINNTDNVQNQQNDNNLKNGKKNNCGRFKRLVSNILHEKHGCG